MKIQATPWKPSVPTSRLAKLSGALNAGTPVCRSTPASIALKNVETKSAAITWITASPRHGFCDNMGLA